MRAGRKIAFGIPILLILLALYLVGLRVYQNRSAAVNAPETTFSPAAAGNAAGNTGIKSGSTEAEEEAALNNIQDRININTAAESELELLDGIGPVLSKRITQKRDELGGFRSIEQLLEVEGIGDKLFDSIKNYIKVE